MRSPIAALTWDIWQRNRRSVSVAIGILLCGWIFNLALPDTFRATAGSVLGALNFTLAFIVLLCVYGIFSYTEFNPQKQSIGFPHRLFVLPVTTLLLVALPVLLGIAAVELVLVWVNLTFAHVEGAPWSTAVLFGAYMVFCQTILWNLTGLRSLRVVLLGVIAIVLIVLGFLPSFPHAPLSETGVIAWVSGLALMAFLASWICVARQRSGGGRQRDWSTVGVPGKWIADAVPRRSRIFDSPEAAQFWYEWRRCGLRLPLYTGTLMLFVIAPLSWTMRHEDGSGLRILVAALAIPIILSLPVGKAFSKPDFWSADLSLPSFIAVRPLATDEMVVTKMKVAAASAAMTWLLVLAFLTLWLPLSADVSQFAGVRLFFQQVYGPSLYRQYAVVALCLIAGMLLTSRFLVGSLWIGLSGNRKLFAASALPYGLFPLGLIALLLTFRPNSPFRAWIRDDPNGLLSFLEWVAVLALIAKFSLAAFSWRKIGTKRARQYWVIWFGGTLCLLALAILLWSGFRHVLPLDVDRLRNVLILAALLAIPLGRLGLAPLFLAKNRHR